MDRITVLRTEDGQGYIYDAPRGHFRILFTKIVSWGLPLDSHLLDGLDKTALAYLGYAEEEAMVIPVDAIIGTANNDLGEIEFSEIPTKTDNR